ncbi:putative ATPase [Coemansia biformis]|uniref:ATPase n=1 Tax=Coemansia biformis TaxID=1286918 RepID=A0A9W8CXE0_9FUNG|nr:putative ATPase [Coemansia biformis]
MDIDDSSPEQQVCGDAEEDAKEEDDEAPGGSDAATEEEGGSKAEPKVSLRELRERAMAQYETLGEEKHRMQRLNFLLEKSAAYVTFVAKRLETKRAEKRCARPTGSGAKKRRKPSEADMQPEARHAADDGGNDGEDEERTINGEHVSPRQPRTVTGGVMREYQLEGMEWLASLYENGLNGILADEMGLGKTLQTIAFLCFLRERQVWGPFLVLCPLSTLSNWASEFYRFAPETPVLLYHGTPDERRDLRQKHLRRITPDFPIVLTTYEISMRDRQALQRIAWKFIIVDEGHRIKNMNCRLVRELKTYQSTNRLLLTGTPLQNSLAELWSLLNFLLPDIFDDLDSFQAWFDFDDLSGCSGQSRVISQETSSSVVTKLHQILQPFLLRRLKSDVEKFLPPKREYLISCPMAPLQFEYYQAVRGPNLRAFLEERFSAGSEASRRDSAVNSDTEDTEGGGGSGELSPLGTGQSTMVPGTPASDADPPKRAGRKRAKDSQQQLVEEAERFLGLPVTQRNTRKPMRYQEVDEDDPFEEALDAPTRSALPKAVAAEGATTGVGTRQGLAQLKAAVQIKQLNLQFRLMQQRKVCQHPYLFDFPVKDPTDPESEYLIDEQLVRASGKLLVLDRLLPALFAGGHRVLIFSQFSRALDILEFYAGLRGWEFCRIDGSVGQADRQEAIVQFNTSSIPLFLLTTRSGGLGINLTSADTVVIFDSDWNPQQDLQAQDRVHRIGQKKPVLIYRLVIAGSCEEPMLRRAKAKRKLEKLVIHERRFKGVHSANKDQVSLQDIKQILMDDGGEVVERDQQHLSDVLGALALDQPLPADLVLSDKELAALTDRSPEAYEKASSLAGASARIAQLEDAPDERNDMLASMDAPE